MEGGLCYFHANPDKAAELGRNGGRRRKHTYQKATEQIAPPESAADVKRMLAETMAEVKAGKMKHCLCAGDLRCREIGEWRCQISAIDTIDLWRLRSMERSRCTADDGPDKQNPEGWSYQVSGTPHPARSAQRTFGIRDAEKAYCLFIHRPLRRRCSHRRFLVPQAVA